MRTSVRTCMRPVPLVLLAALAVQFVIDGVAEQLR